MYYVQNKEDNNQNQINNSSNNFNTLNNNYDVTITADITMESNWNTQFQLESTQDTTYVPHAHTHGQNSTNHLFLEKISLI